MWVNFTWGRRTPPRGTVPACSLWLYPCFAPYIEFIYQGTVKDLKKNEVLVNMNISYIVFKILKCLSKKPWAFLRSEFSFLKTHTLFSYFPNWEGYVMLIKIIQANLFNFVQWKVLKTFASISADIMIQ